MLADGHCSPQGPFSLRRMISAEFSGLQEEVVPGSQH